MSPEKLKPSQFIIEPATLEDVEGILELIQSESDALLEVTEEEIKGWIEAGNSLVVRDEFGRVIAHQGMFYWQQSGVVELRSAVVAQEYRGRGINTQMKQQMIEVAKEKFPGARIAGFTEAASKSRGILRKLGFELVSLDEVPDEMFSVCPETCYRKTGKPCGYQVYFLPEEEE